MGGGKARGEQNPIDPEWYPFQRQQRSDFRSAEPLGWSPGKCTCELVGVLKLPLMVLLLLLLWMGTAAAVSKLDRTTEASASERESERQK